MSTLLKEPLVHFLALGVAIFVFYQWLGGEPPGDDEIVVTRGQQENLIATFERTWRRAPTPDEFRGLVQDYLRQEIAYREAGALELDRNDIVIRRRLRQKLELLAEDLVSLAPPTEAEIESFYAAHAEAFRADPQYSFEHIYVSADARGAAAEQHATDLLGEILSGSIVVQPADLGDPIELPVRMQNASRRAVERSFGAQFAEQLHGLPAGEWTGPVASSYGLHLVHLTERVEGRVPPLDAISADVRNKFVSHRRREAVDSLYETLGQRYSIRVEPLVGPEMRGSGGAGD